MRTTSETMLFAASKLLHGLYDRAIESQGSESAGFVIEDSAAMHEIPRFHAVLENIDAALPISLGRKLESFPLVGFVVS